jgi:hypothetical protein
LGQLLREIEDEGTELAGNVRLCRQARGRGPEEVGLVVPVSGESSGDVTVQAHQVRAERGGVGDLLERRAGEVAKLAVG